MHTPHLRRDLLLPPEAYSLSELIHEIDDAVLRGQVFLALAALPRALVEEDAQGVHSAGKMLNRPRRILSKGAGQAIVSSDWIWTSAGMEEHLSL